ncbi:MAG: hypothetical protein AAF322_10465 [Pseudomonadota bacterium]
METSTVAAFRAALEAAWSRRSSTLWTEETPARGQCGVSALVANDALGGEILKTRWGDIWHFYNRIDGERFDFTESQFDEPPAYLDLPSSREEAFGDTNAEQYGYLSAEVSKRLDLASA